MIIKLGCQQVWELTKYVFEWSRHVVDGQNICFLNSVWKGCMQEYIQEGKSWKPQYLCTSMGPSILVRLKITISYLSSITGAFYAMLRQALKVWSLEVDIGQTFFCFFTGLLIYYIFTIFTPFTCKISHKVCFQPFPIPERKDRKALMRSIFRY